MIKTSNKLFAFHEIMWVARVMMHSFSSFVKMKYSQIRLSVIQSGNSVRKNHQVKLLLILTMVKQSGDREINYVLTPRDRGACVSMWVTLLYSYELVAFCLCCLPKSCHIFMHYKYKSAQNHVIFSMHYKHKSTPTTL